MTNKLVRSRKMDSYNVADAKAHLSALIERAAAGEEIEIRKRGEPVAKLVPIARPRKRVDVEALRVLTEKMTYQKESAGDFMRRLRDAERY
jgi:prevent-host-death family protein